MDEILRFVWGEYRTWAITSRVLKARVRQIGLIVLGLTIGGTALGTLTALLPTPAADASWRSPEFIVAKAVPWLAAAALGLAAFLTNQLLNDSERQTWTKARALAEALKSESFKYLMRVAPYDAPTAGQLLTDKVIDVKQILQGVLSHPVAPGELEHNLPVVPLTISKYVESRIRDQIDGFYRPAITRHRALLTRAKIIALVAGVMTVILSVGTSGLGGWAAGALGFVTTVSASLAAWFQSGHHQQIALNYQDAVTKLELLLAKHKSGGLTDADLVLGAEAVFQAEHGAWLAEWQSAPPAKAEASPAALAPQAPAAVVP